MGYYIWRWGWFFGKGRGFVRSLQKKKKEEKHRLLDGLNVRFKMQVQNHILYMKCQTIDYTGLKN